MLAQTLADVRRRIAKRKKLNENDTKATLIEPVLAALGWDVLDPEEVAREHKAPRAKPVDYALLVLREPKLYVEAKGLGENLGDSKTANQIMGYAAVAGVEWIVLTNGDEWRIYNSHATVPIDQKLLRSVRISDAAGDAEAILGLLSKDQLKTKQIDAMWRAQFVDRRVKAALEGFFDPDKDMALVNHVRTVTRDLSPDDIRGSMRRCKLTLDFPLSPGDLASAPKLRRASRKAPGGEKVTMLDLIRAGLLPTPAKLTRRYKARILEARVLVDGTIECAGSTFSSPSQAGSAARTTITGLREDGRMRATNGWTFWRWRRPDGRVVELDELRREYMKRMGGAAAAGA